MRGERAGLYLYLYSLVFFLALIQLAQSNGPYCHQCELMANEVKGLYRNSFYSVTPDQLAATLYGLCDFNMAGYEDDQCHDFVTAHKNAILISLKKGSNAYTVCNTVGLC